MKSLSFSAVVGVVAGYRHNNGSSDPLGIVAAAWDAAAEQVAATGLPYVAANMTATKTVYRAAWGCPTGGEDTVTVTGVCNPVFEPDAVVWRQAVVAISEAVRLSLKQSTVSVVFTDVAEFVYLRDEAK